MGSLSFSEIVVIVLVILVVFGPRRLPDLARKAGELMAKVRNASASLTESLGTDYEATIEPIKSAKRDFDGIKSDLTKTITSFGVQDTPQPEAPSGDPAPSEPEDGDDPTPDAIPEDHSAEGPSGDEQTDSP
jgi:sec-independent protein translocase protein TatB